MSVLDMLDSYLEKANIYDGEWTQQLYFWRDTENGDDRFIVLQPNGGTALTPQLGADYYFYLFVVGAHGAMDAQECTEKAQEIITYIGENGIDKCLGHIQMQTPLGRPSMTEEKRIVYELLIRVVYG